MEELKEWKNSCGDGMMTMAITAESKHDPYSFRMEPSPKIIDERFWSNCFILHQFGQFASVRSAGIVKSGKETACSVSKRKRIASNCQSGTGNEPNG